MYPIKPAIASIHKGWMFVLSIKVIVMAVIPQATQFVSALRANT